MVRFQLSERQEDLEILFGHITCLIIQVTDLHFDRYESGLLYDTINRAKTCYFENRASWDDMVIRDMNKDVSWETSARQYKDMYVELTPR